MVKSYKSDVRKLLFRMINNYDCLKEQRQSLVLQKQQCIQEIEMLTGELTETVLIICLYYK